MPARSKDPIQQITLEKELHICPACGYTDGFHVSFKKAKSSKGWNVILICPQCHAKYQIDWEINPVV
jgi:uncharacterized protein YbaR (Trm112 family)